MKPSFLIRTCSLLTGGLVALGHAATASAGGTTATVSYAPLSDGPMAIPTLGGTALMALALLLAVMVWRFRHTGLLRNNPLMGVALGVAILASGIGGGHLVYAANFGVAPVISLVSASGGSVNLSTVGTSCILNVTDSEQTITSISTAGGYVIDTEGLSRDGSCPEQHPVRTAETAELIPEAPVCSTSPGSRLAPFRACSVTVLFTPG